ncbi:MAG: tRNA (guanosine(46)-N7)-methyltransferase TrmB [Rhodospirillales bacterium]|nr:tRNA (guanosine(46)-N7)-methyltransferase TrmB [Rhodospirillales bacterium]
MTANNDDTDKRWYGRRQGKPLRATRRRLLEELLPKIRIDPQPDQIPPDLSRLFASPVREVWLEIGFGGGEHLAAQAEKNPDIGFIGCEPFINGVASLLKHIEEKSLTNIRVYDDDVRHLLSLMADQSFGRIYILFPDPWPKTPHHRRRIVKQETLVDYARLLKDGGELRFASDHQGYVTWALWHLLQNPDLHWLARSPRDWRVAPDDWEETRYEMKAKARGDLPVYLPFQRIARKG